MNIFLSGGPALFSSELMDLLVGRGHNLQILSGTGTAADFPPSVQRVEGSALRPESFASRAAQCDTFVRVSGGLRRGGRSTVEFHNLELVALRAAITVASAAWIRHFIHVAVVETAGAVHDIVATRAESDRLILESGVPATLFRHEFPVVLQRRAGSAAAQLASAVVAAVELPACRLRIINRAELEPWTAASPSAAQGVRVSR
jgi:uncharacterized protein YbjT (DUF2867 family)